MDIDNALMGLRSPDLDMRRLQATLLKAYPYTGKELNDLIEAFEKSKQDGECYTVLAHDLFEYLLIKKG